HIQYAPRRCALRRKRVVHRFMSETICSAERRRYTHLFPPGNRHMAQIRKCKNVRWSQRRTRWVESALEGMTIGMGWLETIKSSYQTVPGVWAIFGSLLVICGWRRNSPQPGLAISHVIC